MYSESGLQCYQMCCKEGIPRFKKPHGTHGYVNAVIVSRNLPRATLETHVVFFKFFSEAPRPFFSSILQVAFNFSKQSWRFFSVRSQEKTVGGIVSDTGRASSVVSRAHRGTAFSAEQLGTAQTWWFGSFQLCLVESPSFLLDCVKVMAIQLKCNLYKWCLLFANALALLLSLIAHQRHSMWLWLLNPWQHFNAPWVWFFFANIQYSCGYIPVVLCSILRLSSLSGVYQKSLYRCY